MTYADKLRDPRWQRVRLEIFQRDDWCCTNCGNDKEELHIHHVAYFLGEPWDTPRRYLKTLCDTCHTKIHRLKKLKRYVKR